MKKKWSIASVIIKAKNNAECKPLPRH